MGDSLSAYTVPSSSSTGALDGVRNRLNSTLPPDSGIDSEDPYGKFTVVRSGGQSQFESVKNQLDKSLKINRM